MAVQADFMILPTEVGRMKNLLDDFGDSACAHGSSAFADSETGLVIQSDGATELKR